MTDIKIPFITAIMSFSIVGFISTSRYFGFNSLSDILFEGVTFTLLVYIYAAIKPRLVEFPKLLFGAWLLLFNKIYDLLTEFPFIEYYADNHEVVDTLLDDGSLLLSFLFIAAGLTTTANSIIKQSMKDELTGLYNRKKFNDLKLNQFDLIYFDLNGLKQVNDIKGHHVGDLMIIRFSQVLKQSCLKNEMAFRIGGDEFIVTVHSNRAKAYIEELHHQLDNEAISFSYGVEKTNQDDFSNALIRSDKAMYRMKQQQKAKLI